jgi:hypothetical protein
LSLPAQAGVGGGQLPGGPVDCVQCVRQQAKRRVGLSRPERKHTVVGHQRNAGPKIGRPLDGAHEVNHRRFRIGIGECPGELDQSLGVVGYRLQDAFEEAHFVLGPSAPSRVGRRAPQRAGHPRFPQLRQVDE